jgi:LEA14-like dessication related protein
MKKKLIVVFLLLALIFAACQSLTSLFQEPELSLDSVDLAGISFEAVNLLAHVGVKNPNGFSIPLPKVDWELFINSAPFIQGNFTDNKTIKSQGAVTLDVPLSFSYSGLYNSFASLLEKREAAYDIAMKLRFPIPLIEEKVFNLNFSNVIPIPHVPDISFQGITRKSIGTTMEFILNWEVDNKNSFPFDIENFLYNFKVNNSLWAQGRLDKPPKIKAGGKTLVPLTVSVSAVPVVLELVDIINRGSAVNYDCSGSMNFLSGLSGLDLLNFPLDFKGTTRIR